MFKVQQALSFTEAAKFGYGKDRHVSPKCLLPECERRVPRAHRDYCCHDHRMQHQRRGRWRETWRQP